MPGKKLDNIIYHGIAVFMSLLGRIPESAGNRAGDILGTVWFLFDKKHRKMTLNNIKNAYEDEKSDVQIKVLARSVFKNIARNLFEHTRFHRGVDPENFSRFFTIKGLDNLHSAHAEGKGVLCYSCHLGNWELLPVLSYITGIRFSAVYHTVEFAPMNRYINEKRAYAGLVDMIPLHNALHAVKRCLGKGEIAGLLVDQNVRKRHQGVFINFFNRKACVHKGFVKLAISTKAPVVPVFTYRDRGKNYIEILPKVPLIQTGDEQKDILDNTQGYHSIIEKYIRKYPDQWFWLHNKWKTRPLEELG